MTHEPPPARFGFVVAIQALLVLLGYASIAGQLTALFFGGTFGCAFALVTGIALVFYLVPSLKRDALRGTIRVLYAWLVLVLLVVWGLVIEHFELRAECVEACRDTPYRFFDDGALAPLVALHAATAIAFAISRVRPEPLPALTELAVEAFLVVGIALQAVIAFQFGSEMGNAVFFPFAMPAIAPLLTIQLYLADLVARLRRYGLAQAEKAAAVDTVPLQGVYREMTRLRDPARESFDVAQLGRAVAASPVIVGAYALALAVYEGHVAAATQVFTQTCDHPLSQLPLRPGDFDCHYLCTVAAKGHAGLVRPLRIGKRRGQPILVNRQLAIANAFEDLLHVRWPRFGALARRIYDRVGLPVSRWIRTQWLADAVYIAMKPFEWGFYVVLLVLDREDPEARIDRMYR